MRRTRRDMARRGRRDRDIERPMRRERDRNYEFDYGYENRPVHTIYGRDDDYARRRYDRAVSYPFEFRGRVDPYERYDRRYDMASSEEDYLSDADLMEWSKDLLSEVEEKDKAFFTKDNIERKAHEMGIRFDYFTFAEFYTTALMMYTDYAKTLGTGNIDLYLRLAKDWLCDDDIAVKGSEKLATYYDYIVEGM